MPGQPDLRTQLLGPPGVLGLAKRSRLFAKNSGRLQADRSDQVRRLGLACELSRYGFELRHHFPAANRGARRIVMIDGVARRGLCDGLAQSSEKSRTRILPGRA